VTETPRLPDDELVFRRIVEDSPAAVMLLTSESNPRVLYASPRVEEISGFAPRQLLEHPELWFRRMHPDGRAAIGGKWASSVVSRTRFEADYRFQHRNGEWRWFRETSTPMLGSDGSVQYRQSFIEDISPERFAYTQAERSEARYRSLVERLPVVVYVDSDEQRPRSLYVSPNSLEMLGYAPGDYLADSDLWFSSMHPDDLERVRETWADSIQTKSPFHEEYRDLKPDGTVVWVRDHSIPVLNEEGEPLFWQGVLLDITAEHEAAVMLDRSEARYRELIEHLPVVAYVDAYGPSAGSRYVSPNVIDLLGVPAEAFIADTARWFRMLHPDDRIAAHARWSQGWANSTGWTVEYRFLHRDGHDVWVRDEASMVIDPSTGEQTWQGVIVDLTAARQTEADLRDSERRYRTLVEQVPAIMYEMGPDDERRTLFVSPHVEEILGYPRQEWLDQPDIWVELLHPDDREQELAAHDLHNETGESWQREYRLIASDGRQVWVRDQAELVTGDDGARWLGVMLDISPQKEAEAMLQLANDELEMRVLTRTAQLEDANEMMTLEIGERRRAETKLRQTEERFRALVEYIPGVVYTWRVPAPGESERSLRNTYTSPRIEDLLGFTVKEWGDDGRFWETRLHPHDRDRVIAATQRSRDEGTPFSEEFRYLAKDGSVVWVLEQATLLTRDEVGLPRYFQGVMLDVTDRKEAQEKAEVAEERFRVLSERGPLIVYEYELEHADPPTLHMRYVSPSAADLLGLPIESWQGDLEKWLSMMHPDDVERMSAIARDMLTTGGPWNHIFRIIAGDGRIVWLLDRGQATERDDDGRPSLFQGVLLDVSEEAEVHAALEASEATFRSVVETMPAVPWTEIVDPATRKGRYSFIGPQTHEIFGYPPSELLTEPGHFFRLVHPDDRTRLAAASDRCDRTGEPWDELYRVIHRDGSVRWILSHARKTADGDRAHWQGVSLDVTRHVADSAFTLPTRETVERS
jgi:PAS domain S-box-containing protein